MDTADTILDHLLLACGSVLPYREICSLNLLLESQVKKKSGRRSRGMKRGPVWGSPQAAGKRHSQPFCEKRLRTPGGVTTGQQPKKPGTSFRWACAMAASLAADTTLRVELVECQFTKDARYFVSLQLSLPGADAVQERTEVAASSTTPTFKTSSFQFQLPKKNAAVCGLCAFLSR